jgi:hypothetical protein
VAAGGATLALVLAIFQPSQAREVGWSGQFGGAGADLVVTGAATKEAIYVGGYTTSDLDGGGNAGSYDAFVRRIDHAGDEVWTRQDGIAASDAIYDLAPRGAAVYTAGAASGALPAELHLGMSDAVARRYSSAGTPVWTDQFGTAQGDEATAVATAPGAVYVAGTVRGALPGKAHRGDADAFLRKYTPTGDVVWTRQFGTPDWEAVYGMAVHGSRIFLVGSTSGALPGQANHGEYDAFVRAYEANGSVAWTRQFGTAEGDEAYAVAADESGVYVGGTTAASLAGQPHGGGEDGFVRRFGHGGGTKWTRQLGTPSGDYVEAVEVAGQRVYVAGSTDASLAAQPHLGSADAFAARYSRSGERRWLRQLGSAAEDQFHSLAAHRLGLYAVGYTNGELPDQTALGGYDGIAVRFVSQLPDALISKAAQGGYRGNDVYNLTGNGQRRSAKAAPGATRRFHVRMQNDGDSQDRLRLKGCKSTPRFRVRYSSGGENVTAAVTGGTFSTAPLAPGALRSVRVDIRVRAAAQPGDERLCKVRVRSVASPTLADAVVARVVARA